LYVFFILKLLSLVLASIHIARLIVLFVCCSLTHCIILHVTPVRLTSVN